MQSEYFFSSYSEHAICSARAHVLLYNDDRKEWEHSGGSSGISRVQVYHHPVNLTYRIVGRKMKDHMVCSGLKILFSFKILQVQLEIY